MKKDKSKNFGWRSVINYYTIDDLLTDSLIPVIISIIITGLTFFSDIDSFNILMHIVNISLDLLPNILVLLVAGYTILISFYWSGISRELNHSAEGKSLLNSLNASFAAAIFIVLTSLFLTLIVKLISALEFSCYFGSIINMITLFVLVFFLFFALMIIKDAVVDIYNIGKISTTIERDN
jgi:hypothetical protein